MSDIKLVRKHSLPVAQAKKIAQRAADDLAREYDLQSEWDGDTLRFSRSGVDGEMAVTGSEIRIGVELGFLLRAFRSRIQQHMEHRIDELLLAAGPDRGAGAKTVAKAGGKAASKPAGGRSRKA